MDDALPPPALPPLIAAAEELAVDPKLAGGAAVDGEGSGVDGTAAAEDAPEADAEEDADDEGSAVANGVTPAGRAEEAAVALRLAPPDRDAEAVLEAVELGEGDGQTSSYTARSVASLTRTLLVAPPPNDTRSTMFNGLRRVANRLPLVSGCSVTGAS
jgi:hypothetical protein